MASEPIDERVDRLEDERAIVATLYNYAHGLDYGPEEAFLDVFTPDGMWQRVEGRLPARSFSNLAGLTQMYRDHTHAPDFFHKHVVVNPYVQVDGRTAVARSYLLLVPEHPSGPYVRAFSRCTDRLLKGDDDKWRITKREAELEAWADRDFPPAPWINSPLIVS